MYTDKCTVTDDNVFDLTFIAQKFELGAMLDACTKYLSKKISKNNVCQLTEVSVDFQVDELQEECEIFFKRSAKEVFETKQFLEASPHIMEMLYDLGDLRCSQLDLFNACIKWSKAECERMQLPCSPQQQRDVLEHILPKVKVQECTWNDFMRIVVPAEVLPPEEVVKFIVDRQKPTTTTEVG